MAVDSHSDSTSDRALLESTGRHPDEWFAFLDAQQAVTWTEQQTAGWLVTEGEVAEVSAHVLATRYRRARNL